MNSLITPATPRTRVQARLADGRIFEAPLRTPLADILRYAYPESDPPPIAAVFNGELRELTYPLNGDADVSPVWLSDIDGIRIYRRSLVFLLVTAAAEIYPAAEIFVSHSTYSGGYYCEVRGREPFQPAELERIKERMQAIVAADAPFVKSQLPLSEAIELFRARGEEDKARLLAHRRKETLPIYTLRGRADYFQGYMVPSAGYLRFFDLHAVPPGFVLQFPRQDAPAVAIAPALSYPKLFAVFHEAGEWLDRLGIRSAGALNDAIVAGRLPEISLMGEAVHESRIASIAAEIAARRERVRVVLIAGPSASGKTTFARRLAIQLLAHGLRPLPLSVDDYFVDRERTPLDESGRPDYEALSAVDIALLNEQLLALLAGKTVRVPHYNFVTGIREPGTQEFSLGPEGLILLEGIHGLNPALVPALPPEQIYRVYVSALTQLNLDRHNRVSTTDSRLIRRLVRDVATRGYSAVQTLRRWADVRRGEKLYIFPFQENSDAIFNSALVHELAVLRPLAEPLLWQIRPHMPEFVEANRLLSFLQWFRPAPADVIPSNSILREFIGGSILANFRVWIPPQP